MCSTHANCIINVNVFSNSSLKRTHSGQISIKGWALGLLSNCSKLGEEEGKGEETMLLIVIKLTVS